MNVAWPKIQKLVESSVLNKEEKSNVLEQLDKNIGKYALNYKLPRWHNLTENEFLAFSKIVKLINEENAFPQVSNDAEYKMVVNEIFAFFSKQGENGEVSQAIKDIMINVDAAYANNDLVEVNRLLDSIQRIM